ncbi:possible bacteriophage protein [Fusobacterium polymorphum ATCC 10953]|uniref:Possible bacteriophage protein n=3 Tax=Fusobacterium nucleatum subsp. polymorphum TaxID=76857 RepID=A5TX26_FUSNP|nr:possible bacteriophage protein [Fusobacterium polymorphum ATCC 10953]
MRPDNVNQPNHYQIGNTGLECKDFISAWVGKGNYGVFCFCNIMKYLVRAEKKNKLEDYKKALKYLDMIIEAGADTIVLDIADVGIEVGTKEYAGVDWNAIIAEITKGLSARQALLLDSVFRSLADEDYVNCKDKLINFIKDYEVE